MMEGPSLKRSFEGIEDESGWKRSKLDGHSFEGRSFQQCHLVMLRNLYDTDTNMPSTRKDDDSSVSTDLSEIISNDVVEAELWDKAEKFVDERDRLIHLKDEASRADEVLAEALQFCTQEQESTVLSTPAGKRRIWTDEDSTKTPPNSLSFFSPQGTSRATQSSPSAARIQSPTKCFGLVTSLLQKKCQSATKLVTSRSSPFKPLLESVDLKIESLESKLQAAQASSISKQKRQAEDLLCGALSPYDDPEEADELEGTNESTYDLNSFISKLEMKLRLWSLLAADLKGVVS